MYRFELIRQRPLARSHSSFKGIGFLNYRSQRLKSILECSYYRQFRDVFQKTKFRRLAYKYVYNVSR